MSIDEKSLNQRVAEAIHKVHSARPLDGFNEYYQRQMRKQAREAMRRLIPDYRPDPLRKWHKWFAWHLVEAHQPGYYGGVLTPDKNWSVWWEHVMRRKVIIDSEVYWQYEIINESKGEEIK